MRRRDEQNQEINLKKLHYVIQSTSQQHCTSLSVVEQRFERSLDTIAAFADDNATAIQMLRRLVIKEMTQ